MWADTSGLAITPNKTELVIFFIIPNVTQPLLESSIPHPVDRVKYLQLILDRKLSWTNSEKSVRKASIAYIFVEE